VSQEANFSVTVKTPRGNLVTVRGDGALDWVANLKAAGESGALGLIGQIEASLASEPAAAGPGPAVQVPAPGGQGTVTIQDGQIVSQSRPAQELPADYGVKCDTCGAPAKFEQEGVSRQSGKPYRRYRCTANALHKATFTN
jgi:hypothetical protein